MMTAVNKSTFPTVNGIGYTDGLPFTTPGYFAWSNMLKRAYAQSNKYPTYNDVTVSNDWLHFSDFHRWYLQHYREGYHLDKDLLQPGSRTYSPETCAYIPPDLNTLIQPERGSGNDLPMGIQLFRGKYRYEFRRTWEGAERVKKRTVVCGFHTAEEAFAAYKEAKEAYIRERAAYHYSLGNISLQLKQACDVYKIRPNLRNHPLPVAVPNSDEEESEEPARRRQAVSSYDEERYRWREVKAYAARNELHFAEEWGEFRRYLTWDIAQHKPGYSFFHLPGEPVVGPLTCCYIPRDLRDTLLPAQNTASDLPEGVQVNGARGGFRAILFRRYLGAFPTVFEAAVALQNARLQQTIEEVDLAFRQGTVTALARQICLRYRPPPVPAKWKNVLNPTPPQKSQHQLKSQKAAWEAIKKAGPPCPEWSSGGFESFREWYKANQQPDTSCNSLILTPKGTSPTPDTCVFLPLEFVDIFRVPDKENVGAQKYKGGFRAMVNTPYKGDQHIGKRIASSRYATAEEASAKFKEMKRAYLQERAKHNFKKGLIEKRVLDGMLAYNF